MLLRDFVNKKIASADKEASADGVPLTLNNCKKYKKMRDLKVYGNCFQDGTPTPENPIEVQCVGELVTDESDVNYGKYKAPIICRGINYFSMAKAKLSQKTINGITFTPLDDERMHITGKAIDTSVETNFRWDHAWISIPSGQYVCRRAFNFSTFFGVGINGSWVVNMNANNITTVPDNAYIYYTCFFIPANTTREFDDIITIQVEKGDVSTTYEPYVEPIRTNIYLDEPLRKVHTYADYIDGKNKKLHRLIHEYYIDGSQSVENYNARICIIVCTGDLRYVNDYGAALCNRFGTYLNIVNNIPHITNANANGVRLQINDYSLLPGVTDAISLRAWFKENPTKYYTTLETPIVEDLDIELPKLNAKTTIIEVDTSLAPSNISGKYIIR